MIISFVELKYDLSEITFYIIITLVWIYVICPKTIYKNFIKFNNLQNNKIVELLVLFGESNIIIKREDKTVEIDYNDVINYYRFEKFSTLIFSNKKILFFSESDFSGGSKEEFENFMFDKCKKLKRIKNI